MTARVSHPGLVEEQHAGGQVVRGSNLAGSAETVQNLHLCARGSPHLVPADDEVETEHTDEGFQSTLLSQVGFDSGNHMPPNNVALLLNNANVLMQRASLEDG
jgi:hypothetical protein